MAILAVKQPIRQRPIICSRSLIAIGEFLGSEVKAQSKRKAEVGNRAESDVLACADDARDATLAEAHPFGQFALGNA